MVARALVPLAAALALALGCVTVAEKSRISPQERVSVEVRPPTRVALAELSPLVEADALETRFAALVTTRIARRRSLASSPARADAILALRLHSLEFAARDAGSSSLRVTAASRIETAGEDPGKPRTGWSASEYESPALPNSSWRENDGALVRDEIESALAELADRIALGATRAPPPAR